MKRTLLAIALSGLSLLAVAGPEGGGFSQGPITSLSKLDSIKTLHAVPAGASRHIDVQTWTTSNGADVYFVHADELPMVDVHLTFDAGAARDGGLPGLAQMTSDMLNEGTPTRDTTQIAAAFESLGAQFHQGSYRDMGVVDLRVLTDERFLKPALEVFTDVVAHPTFPADAYQRVYRSAQIGLQQQAQSPATQASLLFFKSLYGDHPYGIPPNGTAASLAKITLDDLKHFHQQYYAAKNLKIALVGDVSAAQARAISEQVSAALPAGAHAAALPEVAPLKDMRVAHLDFPSQQTHILLGEPGITRNDPDFYALTVGNDILGGGGFGSLLTQEIREKRGLSYGVSSGFNPMRVQGPFEISLSTRTDQADEALKITREVLQSFLDNGPSQRQVDDTIANMVGSYPLDQASNGSIVANLGMIGFYGLPLDYTEQFIRRVQVVTPAQIQAAFKRHVHPERMVLVTVGKPAPAPASGSPAAQ